MSVSTSISSASMHVAPMAAVTDRHFRMLARCTSPIPVLWTEMTWDQSLLAAAESSSALDALIGFSEAEHPIVLQLGGCEPETLAKAAALGASRGYDAINLNCGCPAGSRGERQHCYGARLMLEPARVAACCSAMIAAVSEALAPAEVPCDFISVKCRLGVSGREEYQQLAEFISTVAESGVVHFVVHARQAVLNLSAAANRTVPPLQHDWVYRLIADFPSLRFSINGGVKSVEEAAELMERGARGVMVGRGVTADPFSLLALPPPQAQGQGQGQGRQARSRREVLERYLQYAATAQAANWGRGHPETLARKLLAPLVNCFSNTPHAAQWRRALSAATAARVELRRSGSVETITRRCLEECGASAPPTLGAVAVLDWRPAA
jgi:tRNA-dihydrouridine synthase A